MSESTVIQLINIHKKFDDLEVLKGVNLTANKGDIVAILGASGSGKSTLLRCINGLEIPSDGKVVVHNQVLSFDNEKQLDKVRSKLGMVFQSFNLWTHRSVLQNVAEGLIYVKGIDKEKAESTAAAILTKVGLKDKINNYPRQLSGGQKQRVGIARALAMNPDIMLFDEPTSALDPELVGEVLQVIKSLADDGMTMLIVTHEIAFARKIANYVVLLHSGTIVEQGSPKQVIDSPSTDLGKSFFANHN